MTPNVSKTDSVFRTCILSTHTLWLRNTGAQASRKGGFNGL